MYPTRGIFDFCASADNPSAKSKAHRAKQNIFLMPIGSCLISRGRDRPCERPPHRSVREGLPHTVPRVHLTAHRSLGYRCHPFLPLAVRATTSVTRFPGSVSGTSALVVRSPWSTSFPLRTPLPTLPRWLCSPASLVL